MKTIKLFLVLIFAASALHLNAQTEKGNMIIGGTAGFNSVSDGDDNANVLTIAPFIGYFVVDKLAVGGSVGLAAVGGDGPNYTQFELSPLVRYYFAGSGQGRFFGQGNFSYQRFKVEDNDAESGFGFGLGVGVDIFLNDHVAIEAILGYDRFKYDDFDDATGTFGLNIGVAAFIGRK